MNDCSIDDIYLDGLLVLDFDRQWLTVDVPVIPVLDGVDRGVAPKDIDPVPVFVGVMVPVIVADGELVTLAVRLDVIVMEGD
jgi:hypothetical protein